MLVPDLLKHRKNSITTIFINKKEIYLKKIYIYTELIDIHPREIKAYIHTKKHFCTRKWKQPKCPQTFKWINEIYVHTMEYNPSIKDNALINTVWMKLEYIMLSEKATHTRPDPHIV